VSALSAQLAMPVRDVVVHLLPEAVDRFHHGAPRPDRIEPEEALEALTGQVQRVRHSRNMTE
jgi:hypothetical protein